MKILFLGYEHSRLIPWLRSQDCEVLNVQDPIHSASLDLGAFDYLISYGYRHILKKDVLSRFENRAINLHISLLPWNRGADPVFWSFLEGTPNGITIHYIDTGVDTGDIIAQKRIDFPDSVTFKVAYDSLKEAIEPFFMERWPLIRSGQAPREKQNHGGTFHKKADRLPLEHLLTQGLDTPVSALIESGRRLGLRTR